MRSVLIATLAATTALPALAEVNIYSYRQPELIQPLLDGFTEQTGIETNVANIGSGIVERMTAEGARSPADIILSVDISRLTDAKDAGLTQAVESDVLEQNIPSSLKDPEGHWFGLTTRGRIVYASKERVDEGEITTYEDLADPKWEGRICTRSGTHVYNLGLIAAMIEHHDVEYTRDWLEGVKSNLAKQPEGNDRAQVRSIWAGECDISLGNTYYMGAMLEDPEQQEWANSVNVTFPEFEDGGTHVNISGVSMAANAPNPEDAKAFIEYLASPEAQKIYADAVYEYPADPDTAAADLVQSWGEITPDETDLADIAEHRAEALRLVEEVNFDG